MPGATGNPGSVSRNSHSPMEAGGESEALPGRGRGLETSFASLCQFIWVQGEPLPLIYEIGHEIYTQQGIDLPVLKRLEVAGLIALEPAGYLKGRFGRHARLFYHDKLTKLRFPQAENNRLELGHVLLTDTGKIHALDMLDATKPNQAFYEYVIDRWFRQGMIPSSVLKRR